MRNLMITIIALLLPLAPTVPVFWQTEPAPIMNPSTPVETDDTPQAGSGSRVNQATTPVPTPRVDARPDMCEDNNVPEHACVILFGINNGPYTFVRADGGDLDYYQMDLSARRDRLATELTLRVNSADVRLVVTAPDGTPLGTLMSHDKTLLLPASVRGTIIMRVELLTATDPVGIVYMLDAQPALPPAPTVDANAPAQPQPDLLENNWSPALAATIAISTVYDLTFVCPETWEGACGGGDHDYLRLPVKAQTRYVIGTFDLGPGADTVLELFWGSETVPVASNDDAGPLGVASLLIWQAPSDGDLIMRISPRQGGRIVRVLVEGAQTYRFAVATDGTALATQIVARVRSQTQPAPTVAPTPRPIQGSDGISGSAAMGSGSGRSTTLPAPLPSNPAPIAPIPSNPPSASVAQLPTPMPTALEPTVGIQVFEDVALPSVTAEPLLTMSSGVRVGYDRNQNQVIDVDEGIRGLVVYVLDGSGVVRGQGMTDVTGAVRIAYRARMSETLTLTVPYFSWAQPLPGGVSQVEPIVITGSAGLPAVLP